MHLIHLRFTPQAGRRSVIVYAFSLGWFRGLIRRCLMLPSDPARNHSFPCLFFLRNPTSGGQRLFAESGTWTRPNRAFYHSSPSRWHAYHKGGGNNRFGKIGWVTFGCGLSPHPLGRKRRGDQSFHNSMTFSSPLYRYRWERIGRLPDRLWHQNSIHRSDYHRLHPVSVRTERYAARWSPLAWRGTSNIATGAASSLLTL